VVAVLHASDGSGNLVAKTNMLLLLLIWGMSLIKNFCCLIVER
jgi:hypothetical protein